MRTTIPALALLLLPSLARADERVLPIEPVVQNTMVWCWLANGEMVFRYHDIPNVNPAGVYQCGIVGALAGPHSPCFYDCRYCTVPAGDASNVQRMLEQYPAIVSLLRSESHPAIESTLGEDLSAEDVRHEIDADRPIIAAISPSGHFSVQPEHVALIVGYRDDGEGFFLYVNDPFPYHAFNASPYEQHGGREVVAHRGRYVIPIEKFRTGLQWMQSIYEIHEAGDSVDLTNDDDDDDDDLVVHPRHHDDDDEDVLLHHRGDGDEDDDIVPLDDD